MTLPRDHAVIGTPSLQQLGSIYACFQVYMGWVFFWLTSLLIVFVIPMSASGFEVCCGVPLFGFWFIMKIR